MVSLGCPKNLVDGEVMLGRLQGARLRARAPTRREADVIVVNTCAFIDRAKQESVDAILEMAREKEAGRAQRLVVTGCLAAALRRRAAHARSRRSTRPSAPARSRTSCARSDGEATTRDEAAPEPADAGSTTTPRRACCRRRPGWPT